MYLGVINIALTCPSMGARVVLVPFFSSCSVDVAELMFSSTDVRNRLRDILTSHALPGLAGLQYYDITVNTFTRIVSDVRECN